MRCTATIIHLKWAKPKFANTSERLSNISDIIICIHLLFPTVYILYNGKNKLPETRVLHSNKWLLKRSNLSSVLVRKWQICLVPCREPPQTLCNLSGLKALSHYWVFCIERSSKLEDSVSDVDFGLSPASHFFISLAPAKWPFWPIRSWMSVGHENLCETPRLCQDSSMFGFTSLLLCGVHQPLAFWQLQSLRNIRSVCWICI